MTYLMFVIQAAYVYMLGPWSLQSQSSWMMEYCVWENIGGLNIGEWAISESIGELVKIGEWTNLVRLAGKILVNE